MNDTNGALCPTNGLVTRGSAMPTPTANTLPTAGERIANLPFPSQFRRLEACVTNLSLLRLARASSEGGDRCRPSDSRSRWMNSAWLRIPNFVRLTPCAGARYGAGTIPSQSEAEVVQCAGG